MHVKRCDPWTHYDEIDEIPQRDTFPPAVLATGISGTHYIQLFPSPDDDTSPTPQCDQHLQHIESSTSKAALNDDTLSGGGRRTGSSDAWKAEAGRRGEGRLRRKIRSVSMMLEAGRATSTDLRYGMALACSQRLGHFES